MANRGQFGASHGGPSRLLVPLEEAGGPPGSRRDVDDPNGLVDSFVELMVQNWETCATRMTARDYVERIALRQDNYGMDYHDQLSIFVRTPYGRVLKCECSIIQKIPILSMVPDIGESMLGSLRKMEGHLVRKFRDYREAIVMRLSQDTIEEFRELPVAHQIATAARLPARLPLSRRPPKPAPMAIPLS
ncbi:hypothetical protein F4823DRAFT_637473 [Ustulina deusta]|nr:hypothetical protein F4823DRAFT_637473 [Ustulina deusta]